MLLRIAAATVAAVCACAAAAGAQDAASFYKGKQITVLVGTGPGTTYDIYARTLAEHLGRHLPGTPNFIVQTIPGAGGAKAAQMLYNTVAKDGTYLGVLQPNLVLSAVLDEQKPLFDYAKFGQIGGFSPVNGMLSVSSTAPATTLEGAKTTELFMGTTGPGSDTYQAPKLANALLGTKFKVLSGYKDVGEMELAMERGELHGRGGSVLSWTSRKPDWISGNKIVFLFQMGPKADPAIPTVPLLQDLVKSDEDKKIVAFFNAPTALGRGVMTTPDVPAVRLAALRTAFIAMTKDAKFLADAKTRMLDIDPLTAEVLEKTVAEATSLTPALAAKARETQN